MKNGNDTEPTPNSKKKSTFPVPQNSTQTHTPANIQSLSIHNSIKPRQPPPPPPVPLSSQPPQLRHHQKMLLPHHLIFFLFPYLTLTLPIHPSSPSPLSKRTCTAHPHLLTTPWDLLLPFPQQPPLPYSPTIQKRGNFPSRPKPPKEGGEKGKQGKGGSEAPRARWTAGDNIPREEWWWELRIDKREAEAEPVKKKKEKDEWKGVGGGFDFDAMRAEFKKGTGLDGKKRKEEPKPKVLGTISEAAE
ncbi:hypothetical protein L873DRAFT_1848638 [Choiromyces venosus 120613-1]|uniref:Uncharacterized protein n=1 Tax=Choiromyces venosus 120613-1 TaxID=1336337 RepID=A0A3N4J2M3_9PEZI|nr:hypothetical protein L873DRAFT_1848638 [Choiromyces venosus 120613-1]